MSDIKTFSFTKTAQIVTPLYIAPLADAPQNAISTQPRRHSFHLIIWIESGVGANVIDFVEYPVAPRQLHLVMPGQVHFWRVSEAPKGFYLMFTEELFMKGGFHNVLPNIQFFDPVEPHQQVLTFDDSGAVQIKEHLDGLILEATETKLGWLEAAAARLKLLLILAQRKQAQAFPIREVTMGQKLTRRFLELVEEEVMHQHSLGYFADKLGVTVGHLSETSKTVTGLPASQLVRQRLTLEAKRLLVHSELTVAQIAERLNFADASYFGRFFKRETGSTPKKFRYSFH